MKNFYKKFFNLAKENNEITILDNPITKKGDIIKAVRSFKNGNNKRDKEQNC